MTQQRPVAIAIAIDDSPPLAAAEGIFNALLLAVPFWLALAAWWTS